MRWPAQAGARRPAHPGMGPTRGGIEDWLREQRRKIPCVEMLFACVGAKGLEESPAVEALGDKIR